MKLKRTIAASLKENEKIQVPDGELWVGYIDNNMVVEIVGAGTSKVGHWGYGHALANASFSKPTNIDTGRTRRFYATPGSQIAVEFSNTFTATFAFTCLVFDISKEVSNV
ncbi:hypothetical protein HKO22_07140 [Peptoniphilus sp. AGMB00490]|uniref:Uncharacterized protein n=1 Tax=Peptoniphilus faecalis TaxID=2731255 RepID=A0A848RK10_9FIRM|nr:hypothetical protein [Peptoniphilus faecalis]NMW85506.1 hypothetical protein [Peptoniphilus faecalis]